MRHILALLLAAMALAAPAQAETSSWSSQSDQATSSPNKKAPAAAKTQKPGPAQKSPPAAQPSPAPPVSEGVSSHAKGAPQSEDPAYEAFDQGRYLTALELAVKAAEGGDPQAHTLVGRIYGEGDGVAKNSALAAKWYARGAELGDPAATCA